MTFKVRLALLLLAALLATGAEARLGDRNALPPSIGHIKDGAASRLDRPSSRLDSEEDGLHDGTEAHRRRMMGVPQDSFAFEDNIRPHSIGHKKEKAASGLDKLSTTVDDEEDGLHDGAEAYRRHLRDVRPDSLAYEQ